MSLNLTEIDLDHFVAESDNLGGPGTPACEDYWQGFSYTPSHVVDQSLDPFSETYVQEQLALHREISGKSFDQAINEQHTFPLEDHVQGINPYNHPDPAALAMHVQRLSKAFRLAGVRRDQHLLDMGCGWGLSSEIAAYLGLKVSAVDINPTFVELVNRRAQKSGWRIQASQAAFDEYRPVESYDAVLFYECLHHAVRPWTLLQTMADSLSQPDGRLILAGEPINGVWWKHWGLRLDALSIYCIRKFGWFESGWTLEFLEAVFEKIGLRLEAHADADPEIGYTILGTPRGPQRVAASELLANGSSDGLEIEQDWAVLTGRASFDIEFLHNAKVVWLEISNHRDRAVAATIRHNGTIVFKGEMPTGDSRVRLAATGGPDRVEIEADTWRPSDELGGSDHRLLSLHLTGMVYD